jgi:hypothetical protein
MICSLNLLLVAFLASPVTSFVVAGARSSASSTNLAASVSTQDDLLKPSYEIEPITIRIGHGFDIHRMAPIEEAGQPMVIGGVVIDHKDQKVSKLGCISGVRLCFLAFPKLNSMKDSYTRVFLIHQFS